MASRNTPAAAPPPSASPPRPSLPGQHHDRQHGQRRGSAQRLEDFPAPEFGQSNVSDGEMGAGHARRQPLLLQKGQGGLPVARGMNPLRPRPILPKRRAQQTHICGVIRCEEHVALLICTSHMHTPPVMRQCPSSVWLRRCGLRVLLSCCVSRCREPPFLYMQGREKTRRSRPKPRQD